MKTGKALGKSLVFGAVVGMALGLFLFSISLVLTSLWAVFFTCWIVLIFLLLGLIAGWRRWLPNVKWWIILLLIVVGWPLCFGLPIGVRILQFHCIAFFKIPVYPGAKKIKTTATALAADDEPRVEVILKAKASEEELTHFYSKKLIKFGWRQLPPYNPGNSSAYAYSLFEKPGYQIGIVMWDDSKEKGTKGIRITYTVYNLAYSPIYPTAKTGSEITKEYAVQIAKQFWRKKGYWEFSDISALKDHNGWYITAKIPPKHYKTIFEKPESEHESSWYANVKELIENCGKDVELELRLDEKGNWINDGNNCPNKK